MIFYEIELLSAPVILFACSAKIKNYQNRFNGNKNFLEFSLIEEGDVLYSYANKEKEVVPAKAFAPIVSDLYVETSAYNRQIQAHTTVGVSVQYNLKRRSSAQEINLKSLNERIKNGNVILIPFHTPMGSTYQPILSQLKKIASLNTSLNASTHISAISEWFSLCKMLTDFVLKQLSDYNASLPPSTLNYISSAKEYIHENYMNNINVSDIAQALGISVGYLHNLFKSAVGLGVTEYINIYRIEIAKQLIASRNLPLKAIAELIGISDPAYLSRLFKKTTGISYNDYKYSKRKDIVAKY